MNSEIDKKINQSIPPSWYVKHTYRYTNWCSICECLNCGLLGKYEDLHPANPCPSCGKAVKEKVGRWKKIKLPWWNFWTEKGYWEVLPND